MSISDASREDWVKNINRGSKRKYDLEIDNKPITIDSA